MKKVFLSAALALAVAGSWAFYPKAPAEPGGYMMVVGRLYDNNILVATITSDGQYGEDTAPITKLKYINRDMHKAQLLKLNQLRQNGWRVVTTASTGTANGNGNDETTYLLEKP